MGSTSRNTEGSPPPAVTPSDTSPADGKPAGAKPAAAEPAGDGESLDRVLVGLITRPHGVRGEVKVEIWSDVPNRFDPGRELLVETDRSTIRKLRIASFRPARGGGIVHFDGCRDRNQAEALRGAQLAIPRSEVPAAPAGQYYHFDLVGCRCVDAELGELGEVQAVAEDGGGVLLEVAMPSPDAGATTPRILSVPFVQAFLESVDVAGKQIRLRLPPGLVETCASRF